MLCSDICVCENHIKLSLKMHFPYGTLLFQIGVYVLEGICRTPGVPFIRRLTNQAREQKKQLPTVAGNGMANLVKVLVHQVKEVNEITQLFKLMARVVFAYFIPHQGRPTIVPEASGRPSQQLLTSLCTVC